MTPHHTDHPGRARPYLCYVHRPDKALADLTVLTCRSDEAVEQALDAALDDWPHYTWVTVYDGQRRVLTRPGPAAPSPQGA